jgi:O-antigen ligase
MYELMYDVFKKMHVKSGCYFPRLAWYSQHRAELLVLLFILLLPFGETSHLPVVIFLFLSVKDIWRNGFHSDFDSSGFLWIAIALIVPLLISTIGAYDIYRTMRTALVFTLYSIAGVYLIRHFREQLDIDFLLYGISGILLFWTADALLQYFHGTNIFGWPGRIDGITGMYGYKLWIGYTFAHLAPFLFESLRRWSARPGFKLIWLLVIPFIMVIMLTGRRAAWVTLGLVSSIYMIWLVRHGDIKFRHLLTSFTAFCLAIGAAVVISPELQLRVQTTMKVFSGTWDSVNLAGANRLEVWRGAWLLYMESPLIGVGAHAYDPFVFERGYTISKYGHAHLYGLDVLLSTGLIGFVAFVGAFFYLCIKLFQSIKLALPTLPAWLAAVSIMFPLNAHWNFYAPRPASLFWMLIILAIAIAAHYRAKIRVV